MADHTFVLVRKHGSPTKYRAEIQAVGHECDLAILTVESEEFWEGMNFLELGDIPFLQEAVAVVGYPQGNNGSNEVWTCKNNYETNDLILLNSLQVLLFLFYSFHQSFSFTQRKGADLSYFFFF